MRKGNYKFHFTKVIFVIFFLALLAFISFGIRLYTKSPEEPLCKDCNVILVSLDTLSANHLPCYGYERNTAPSLCSLAQENVFFQNMYANSTWTLPSHVSIFTGLIPETHGVNSYGDNLDPKFPFLPSILKDNGYKTIFFIPPDDPTLPKDRVYNRGIDDFFDSHKNSWNEALDLFKENVKNDNKTFLFLHTYAVHDPYLLGSFDQLYHTAKQFDLPKRGDEIWGNFSPGFLEYFVNQFPNDIEKGNTYIPDPQPLLDCIREYKTDKNLGFHCLENYYRKNPEYLHDYFYHYYWIQKIDTNDPDQIDYIKALYDQKIRELDLTMVRNLIFFWQNENIRKNTILIITSDHGEEFMEHGHIAHVTAYDSNLRIPMIIALPKRIQKIITYPAQSADITPTLLDALGVNGNFNFQGESLIDAISGKKLKDRITVADGWHLSNKTVRKDGWKLFLKRENQSLRPYELYNLNQDPQESNNIMLSNQKKVDELKEEYNKFMKK